MREDKELEAGDIFYRFQQILAKMPPYHADASIHGELYLLLFWDDEGESVRGGKDLQAMSRSMEIV